MEACPYCGGDESKCNHRPDTDHCDEMNEIKKMTNLPTLHPQHKIDCGAAAYLMDASAELARLNERFDMLNWRVRRGETDMILTCMLEIRSSTRKFLRALEMVEHCLKTEDKEQK